MIRRGVGQSGVTFVEVVVALGLLIPSTFILFQLALQSLDVRIRSKASMALSQSSSFLESYLSRNLNLFWATVNDSAGCALAKTHFESQNFSIVAPFLGFEFENFEVSRELPSGLTQHQPTLDAYQRCRTQQTFVSTTNISSLRQFKFCLHLKPVGTGSVLATDYSFMEVDYFMLDLRNETSVTCSVFKDIANRDSVVGRVQYRVYAFSRSNQGGRYINITKSGVFNATP